MMKEQAWDRFKSIALPTHAAGEGRAILALIVDSPWLPGFMGISVLDYFALPDEWLRANLFLEERFPSVAFLPGFWVEYGMASEPSAFGCRISWSRNGPPSIAPAMREASDVSRLAVPDPSTDGLMPLVLSLYRRAEESLGKRGRHIRMAAARGPLAIAGHLRGVTELMMDLKLEPDRIRTLLEITTETTIAWLKAQLAVLPEAEGIMVLDDIVGFLSPEDYREFAHPLLKQIFSAFSDKVKIYHNDSRIGHILEELADTGFHVLNFSHTLPLDEVYRRIGDKVRLMGNVPPLEVLARGGPEAVRASAKACMAAVRGAPGFILSAGGGVSPGTPAENIDALASVLDGAAPPDGRK